MAAARRGQGPMKLEISNGLLMSDIPPIAALFLIYFDIKAGYTISWKRSLTGIELEGFVEYKSLPSGLHTVKEDLIYFVHDHYAGLSAFVNAPAAEESRNARMIAVGVLVPLSYGRLGRSWKHAENLKSLAQKLVVNPAETKILEDYWQSYKAYEDRARGYTESSLESPSAVKFKATAEPPKPPHKHSRNRSASDGTALLPPGQNLSAYHPAWSLSTLLDTFGPLIFPIHRAAMLRKRILISCHAPVHQTCNFVYDISVISNLPLAVSDLVSESAPPQRLRPLFTIGVHDIPLLEHDLQASTAQNSEPTSAAEEEDEDDEGHGWIACTTDGILAMKDTLYDVLITMPSSHSVDSEDKVWPKIESPRGVEVKATQRDLRRYRALRWGLSRPQPQPPFSPLNRTNTGRSAMEGIRRTLSSTSLVPDSPMMVEMPDTDTIIEPLSWSALAYTGFMWWASAGERSIALNEETESDSTLLESLDVEPQSPLLSRTRPMSPGLMSFGGSEFTAKREMAIVTYFHRLTTLMFTTLSNIVDATASDDEDDESSLHLNGSGADGPAIYISGVDLVRMGLDEWSATDRTFVEDLVSSYFDRRAQIESRTVDICGIRVC